MLGGDALGGIEIGNGAGDLQNAVVRAGGKTHPAHGHFENSFAGFVESAQLAQLTHWDIGVVRPALLLHGAGADDPLPNLGGAGAVAVAAQLQIRQRGHFDVQIDTIEQRPADLAQIALDDATGTTAFSGGIAKISAGASV